MHPNRASQLVGSEGSIGQRAYKATRLDASPISCPSSATSPHLLIRLRLLLLPSTMTPDTTTSGGAPPSYQSAVSNDAAAQQEGETGKADVDKADTKRGEGNMIAPGSTTAPVASSSQLCAPAGANKVEPKFGGPDHEYRKRDKELWPYCDPFLPIVAVYGLYIESDEFFAEPHTIKLTDLNGGILWHFRFPLWPWPNHWVLFKQFENKGTVWMVPGDQDVDNVSCPETSCLGTEAHV